jgi:glycosyltransferase involved in cell wall biosynthesis
MKILLFWWHFFPDKVGFALAVRGEAFAKYLKRLGNDVLVHSPDYSHTNEKYVFDDADVERVPTIESLRAKHNLAMSILLFPFTLLKLLRKVKEFSPDVIIVSQPSYTLPIQGVIVSKLLGKPCILDLQDIFVQEVKLTTMNFINRLKLYFERIVLKEVDFIFVVLPYMRDVVVETYNIPANKFQILYNGVDSEKFPKADLPEEKREIDLIHMGGPKAYYDTKRLIDAFEKVVELRPNTNLVFTDYTDEGYQKMIKERAESKKLLNNIRFLKQVSRAELMNMLGRSKMGVYTLYNDESSKVVVGTKIFEYLMMGLPIAHIGWKGGNMDRIIEENDVGVIGHNIEEFASSVVDILENTEKIKKLRENARRAISKYDWKNTVPFVYERHVKKFG